MRSASRGIFIVLVATILFSLGFYRNRWRVVDPVDIQFRRDVSEIYVMGRLVKSHQSGIFSAGGLLGIGDVSDFSVTNRVIRNQTSKYFNGNGFDKYWAYKSTSGFQGILFSLFDQYTRLTPEMNLIVFRWAVSISLAVILALFCLWLGLELNWLAPIPVIFFITASKWLTIMGGNLYWCLGAFYLPLVALSYLLRARGSTGTLSLFTIFIWGYCLVLLKILFTGFEFITTALLMLTVPFVYYFVLEGWGWKILVQRMLSLGMAMFGAVVTGLLILGLQVKAVLGSYAAAREYIHYALLRRTTGDTGVWINPFEVLRTYLNGYAFDLAARIEIGPGLLKEFLDGKYILLILAFMIATVMFLARYSAFKNTRIYQTGVALIVTCWYSLLAPLSWFIIFKEHATIHVRLDYLVWQMPFMLYGMALVGFVLASWRRPRSETLV